MADLPGKNLDSSVRHTEFSTMQFEQDPAVLAMIEQLEAEGKLDAGEWIGERSQPVTVRVPSYNAASIVDGRPRLREDIPRKNTSTNDSKHDSNVVLGHAPTLTMANGPRFANNGTAIEYPGLVCRQVITPQEQTTKRSDYQSDDDTDDEYEKARQRAEAQEHSRVRSATIRSFIVEIN